MAKRRQSSDPYTDDVFGGEDALTAADEFESPDPAYDEDLLGGADLADESEEDEFGRADAAPGENVFGGPDREDEDVFRGRE
jgi:hypothetical protein